MHLPLNARTALFSRVSSEQVAPHHMDRHHLPLLPSGPDGVRGRPLRGTCPSTPLPREETTTPDARGQEFGPAIADCGKRAPLPPRLARSRWGYVNGGDERTRTADPLVANEVLSQLSYIPTQQPKWRREGDSNPRSAYALNGFRDRPIQPLWHLSVVHCNEERPKGQVSVVYYEKKRPDAKTIAPIFVRQTAKGMLRSCLRIREKLRPVSIISCSYKERSQEKIFGISP